MKTNYTGQSRFVRQEFSASILSENDMKKEMRSIIKINPKGLNALVDLTRQFDKLYKVKKFSDGSNGIKGHMNGVRSDFMKKTYFKNLN